MRLGQRLQPEMKGNLPKDTATDVAPLSRYAENLSRWDSAIARSPRDQSERKSKMQHTIGVRHQNLSSRRQLLARRLQFPSPTLAAMCGPDGNRLPGSLLPRALTKHWRRLRLLPGPEGCPLAWVGIRLTCPSQGPFLLAAVGSAGDSGRCSFHVPLLTGTTDGPSTARCSNPARSLELRTAFEPSTLSVDPARVCARWISLGESVS